ncbi:MAG: M42 family metallopeptidase [Anaerolineaceae bacterium]|nr:M42 family metallopeptidase [Anaerolineaceae bacterium]MCY4008921.1 M42 family metallopeptidase [Anaerolineaceae bacterium]
MILRRLSEAVGVSGDEGAIRDLIIPEIADHVTDLRIDPMGGITARQSGTGAEPRLKVMVCAHMDEVGFMVVGHSSEGRLRVTNVGGIDARILPGLRLRFGQDAVPGVVMWPPIHKGNNPKTIPLRELPIDIGAKDKAEAQGAVPLGTYGVFESEYRELGEKMLLGRAFDDRVGCALLIELLQAGPHAVDLLASFSVQEEIGLRGARIAANHLQPDIGIVLEGPPALDIPDPTQEPDDRNERNPSNQLGAGPSLTTMDRSMIADPRLLRFVVETAERHGIPYQMRGLRGGGTDAGAIHLSNAGVPSAVISVPCRYVHAPAAMLHRDDYDQTLALLRALTQELTQEVLTWDE